MNFLRDVGLGKRKMGSGRHDCVTADSRAKMLFTGVIMPAVNARTGIGCTGSGQNQPVG
jgi:hypothetical protein